MMYLLPLYPCITVGFYLIVVPPEVTVTSSSRSTCTVTRSNPTGFTYTWTNVNTTTTLPGETAATLTLTSITMDEIATYSCEVTNSGGDRGTGTLTLQRGCELLSLLDVMSQSCLIIF